MLLYVIRHGDPIYDPDTLTPKGRLQAAAVAKRLAVHGLDEIYSSPLGRARETAQPSCELMGLPMQIEEWTSESLAWRDLGITTPEGRHGWAFHVIPHARYLAEYAAEQAKPCDRKGWEELDSLKPYNLKPGVDRIAADSDAFLARMGYVREGAVYRAEKPNSRRIAVFCHQGFGTIWLSHLLSIPAPVFWAAFDLTHSSVTILHFPDAEGYVAPQCLCLSDVSHIYREGLPLQYNNRIDI